MLATTLALALAASPRERAAAALARSMEKEAAAVGEAAKSIYVFGPESSGTRYISRSLAKAMNAGTSWDGELPVPPPRLEPPRLPAPR